MKSLITKALTLILALPALPLIPARAWSEGGHHLIATIAFDRLAPEQQTELLAILENHPRYAEEFEPPEKLPTQRDVNRWLAGRAGYWPDVARRLKGFNRPTWHYELGPSLILGDRRNLDVPERPGPLPQGADLETQKLYIAQAIALCNTVLQDASQPASAHALAICWLGHLVADAHQPCHAGSLYAEGVFEQSDGDRGANRIITRQKGNLHALWDQLLGPRFSLRAMRRRIVEINSDRYMVARAELAIAGDGRLNPQVWLEESRQAAIEHVYTPEILGAVNRVARRLVDEPERIELSEAYLKNAGGVARIRALEAGYRLAEVWGEGVNRATNR